MHEGPASTARASARRRVGLKIVATLLVAAGVVTCKTVAAEGTGSLTITPSAGLTKKQIVHVSASGLPKNSKGYLMECNLAPSEPTVSLRSPVNDALPVGCSPPSLKSIYMVDGSGNLSATFSILLGRKYVGPPCRPNPPNAGCPGADSLGQPVGFEAQKYPCPPTPAQQVAGVSCVLMYLDASGQRVTGNISFAGGGPPVPTTAPAGGGGGGGGGGGTTTTVKGGTTTTAAHTTTTAFRGVPTTLRVVTAANSLPQTTAAKTTASGAHLAYTGPGPLLEAAFVAGALMVLGGAGLWLSLLARMRPAFRRRQQR